MMNKKYIKGFTLVELAIVISIIGLLIGGILKGEELIRNAELKATISDIKAVQAAHNLFRSNYKALAGDMDHATTSLANCDASTNCTNGDGNGVIHYGESFKDAIVNGPLSSGTEREMWLYWKHLALAGLIKGVDISDNGTDKGLLTNDIGGYFNVGNARGTENCGAGPNFKRGIWMLLSLRPNANCAHTDSLGVRNIAAIDKKIDDGLPNSGSFRAGQDNSLANCIDDSGSKDIYDEANDIGSCSGLFLIE